MDIFRHKNRCKTHIWEKFMDKKMQKTDRKMKKNAYKEEKCGQNVQKTIKKVDKNAYIVGNCAKLCKKRTKNAYIGGKSAENGQKIAQKRIYRRKK